VDVHVSKVRLEGGLDKRRESEAMPWSKAQKRTAQAVVHGWKPKGSAKGFDPSFAQQVLTEGTKRKIRKHLKVEGTK
jgi:hypothetical protein